MDKPMSKTALTNQRKGVNQMAAAEDTTTPADRPIHTTSGALRELFEKAYGRMDAEELSSVGSVLAANAIDMSKRMSEVTETLACLVANDGISKDSHGGFQNSDQVFGLLCMISQQFDVIAGLMDVADESRWIAQAKAGKTQLTA